MTSGRLFPVPPQPLEKEFQRQVIELAQMLGFMVAHFRPALTKHGWRTPVAADGAGFPDLLMLGHGRQVVRELKVGKNPVRPDQQIWIERFQSCGVDADVWRPGDWDSIARDLGATVAS